MEKWRIWRFSTVASTLPCPWNRTVVPLGNFCAGTFTRLPERKMTDPSSVSIKARLRRPVQIDSPGLSSWLGLAFTHCLSAPWIRTSPDILPIRHSDDAAIPEPDTTSIAATHTAGAYRDWIRLIKLRITRHQYLMTHALDEVRA
ncbi:MAG TPA: hypothetical protein VKN63_09455 [Afifellaceae bacterium]|nr:hypothetical protein [Afifellaceae bacterium]